MGKSTTAGIFANHGCAVWDADVAVHRLYAPGGAGAEALRPIFPAAVSDSGVDRNALKALLRADPSAIDKLNAIIHPLVADDRADFIADAKQDILIFDIPLLFENDMADQFDATVCVFTSAAQQSDRVMARQTMTMADLEFILSKQLPAGDKAARADYVVHTDTMAGARKDVSLIMDKLKDQLKHA